VGKKEAVVKDALEVRCPFCFGHYVVDVSPDPELAVFHSMPPCETFMAHDIQDYLKLARRQIAPETFD
jgi:hypothetical protein